MVLVHKLFKEGRINDDDRDKLKDMIIEEDAILLSFFQRFDKSEENLLIREMLNYLGKSLDEPISEEYIEKAVQKPPKEIKEGAGIKEDTMAQLRSPLSKTRDLAFLKNRKEQAN